MDKEKQYIETIQLLKNEILALKESKSQLKEKFEAGDQTNHLLFDEMPLGFSLNKIIYDNVGYPVNYIILNVNAAFEQLSGFERGAVIGKKALDVFPKLNPGWIMQFTDITKSGTPKTFKKFSFDSKKYFDIQVYSPRKDHFAFTLTKADQKQSQDFSHSKPKEFYERILEHLHEGICVTDKNDTIYFSSPGVTLNTGKTHEKITGKNIFIDLKDEITGRFVPQYLKAKTSLAPLKYEADFITSDDGKAVLAGWFVPLIKDQKFDGMICTIRDTSEEKKNREIIRKSEEKLRNIVEHSTNVFYSHKTDHLLTYLSPQIENLLGFTPEEAKVKWTELTSDNPINKIGFDKTNKAIKTGKVQKPYELELVHKNGNLVWIEVREAPLVLNGKTTSIVGALTDITEQKKIAKQLMENQQDLRNLIDKSPVPIAINNKSGDIEYLNDEFTHSFGYTSHDIPHVDDWFLLAYPNKIYREKIKKLWQIDTITQVYNRPTKTPFEASITCKDGSIQFVQIVWSYIEEKLVLIFQDFTEHKKLEDQIIQKNSELETALNKLQKINVELKVASQKAKESDRLKSAFLANMSHEIRTPMNSIIGFSSLLSQKKANAEQRERYTNFIQKSGAHLLRIIDDIIDIAKIESNQLKIEKNYFAIVPFLQNTYEYHSQSSLLQGKPEIKLILNQQQPGKHEILFTDPIRLKQVFDNLLTNSIKNTIKGSVEFGIHKTKKNSITFYVSDTGVGIPEKFKKSIFKRFSQIETNTLKQGTGLGLSIIKGITNLLEGEIWFESTENAGTTFYVKFPILPEE